MDSHDEDEETLISDETQAVHNMNQYYQVECESYACVNESPAPNQVLESLKPN